MTAKGQRTAAWLLAPLTVGIIGFFIIPFLILQRHSFTFGVGGAEFVGCPTIKTS
jgi:hypothetical protein